MLIPNSYTNYRKQSVKVIINLGNWAENNIVPETQVAYLTAEASLSSFYVGP